jgi:hypothetical protein
VGKGGGGNSLGGDETERRGLRIENWTGHNFANFAQIGSSAEALR